MPSKAAAKSSSKRAASELEDPEVDLEEAAPAPAAAKAVQPPKKKKMPPVQEPEPEEAEEEEPEESEEAMAARKKATTKRRKKAKLVGYRTLARQAGYIDRAIDTKAVDEGGDCNHSPLSVSDAKRLMRFVPSTPGAITFSSNEFKQRMDLHKASVPESAARETQARCDAVLRAVINQAVLRTVEAGKKTVTASTAAAVLRPFCSKLEFTAVVPPPGLVRYAQDAGILESRDEDVKARVEEKKEATANKKAFTEFAEAEQKRIEASRAKRASTASKMAELTKAAAVEVGA